MTLLEQINCPQELRKLSKSSLRQVSDELREFIIEVISQQGGHFASNLGSVELSVALHYVFDTPRDRILWDVGHQSYGHKVLTGRRENFHTIRKYQGIAGFTCRSESEFDHFGAGHASTALSAALGIAEGLSFKGLPNLSIAVVGDGALTGGLCYEAMNNTGHIPAKNVVVILNDNDMSIDPNVGALQTFINRTVTNPGYNRLRKDLKGLLSVLSEHGVQLEDLAGKVRKGVKNFLTPGMLFECFGFRYFGPVNGHDIEAVVDALQFIKNEGPDNGPYLLHALTTKGRGYKLAEEMPIKYHGVSPFKVKEGIQKGKKKLPNYQDIFTDTLIRLAKDDPRVIPVTAAMPSGTGLVKFQKEFPGRFYDVGIAESHAVLFAAGLATEGFRPIAAIYSTFLQRAYDQVIHDVAVQNLPVVFCLDRAGCVGADGATHQGQYDLSYLRAVPNMVVMAPKDENELQHMLKTAVEYDDGPIAVRYPRGPVVGISMDDQLENLPIGKAELLGEDDKELDVLLVAIGYSVQPAIQAREVLRERGLRTGLINARFAKPIDEQMICGLAKRSQLVVTIEENTCHGGFGSAVLEAFTRNHLLVHSLNLGMPDRIVEHGTQGEQRKELEIDSEGIVRQTLEKLRAIDDTDFNSETLQATSSLENPSLMKH